MQALVAAPQAAYSGVAVTLAAQEAAQKMKDQSVSTEHLLIALTHVDDQAKRLLEMHGVEEADVLSALKAVRGGHQVNWFFDGIPVINTNIAANVAPLINPKNMEELQIERGGFSSEYGDRTYGFFNVVTPSGFERNNEVEWMNTMIKQVRN